MIKFIKNKIKGMSLVEVMVAMVLASVTMVYGTAFFIRAFNINYGYSEYMYHLDMAVNVLERQRRGVASNRSNTTAGIPVTTALGVSYHAPGGDLTSLCAYADSVESTLFSGDYYDWGGKPLLMQVYYVSVWPVNSVQASNFYSNKFMGINYIVNKAKEISGTEIAALKTYYVRKGYEVK